MIKLKKNLKENYSPLYFLSALGAGGIVITFFMYLVFITPHKGFPIPNFETLSLFIANSGTLASVLTILVMAIIAFFLLFHFYLLFWNIKEYQLFKKTQGYTKLRTSNAEVQLMAIPLTFGMTISVLFAAGALFVPGLWSVVEYLFPFALVAFSIIGYYAIRIFTDYATRVLTTGSFDTRKNNNLSQMLGVFAFTMVGVGFSASAAMSHNIITSGIGMIFAILFTSIAVIFAIIKIVTGFHSMLEHGADKETSVSLWIMIPIMTLIGITVYRLSMAMHHNFGAEFVAVSHMTWFTFVVSIQTIFGVLGYTVMKKMGYFKSFLSGEEKSPSSYALVCPGVAVVVMSFFFIHKGLVSLNLVSQFSPVYLLLLLPVVVLQFKTILVYFKLNKKLIKAV
jgi:hypothetical protein